MRLRDLKVSQVSRSNSLTTLLCAFRQNGSLQAVFFSSRHGHALFSTAELQRIQSYCDQNRWASGLLQMLGTDELEEDGLILHKDTALLPSLLHAVKPAR
jgi:hypothetical protein